MSKSAVLILLIFLGMPVAADELLVRIAPPPENNVTYKYFYNLLILALNKTVQSHGPYRVVLADEPIGLTDAIASVRRGETIDLLWMITSSDVEAQLKPVRVPLFKGLLGYRVASILRNKQDAFAGVTSVDQLKTFRAGQGEAWPDTAILQENGFTVIGISSDANIYSLLLQDRIDYFPRSIVEAWAELETLDQNQIIVDEHIMLSYEAPVYFFVNILDNALHERLGNGLRLAMQDGCFDKLFTRHFDLEDLIQRIGLPKRRVFELTNPFLPSQTPLPEPGYWLNVTDLTPAKD